MGYAERKNLTAEGEAAFERYCDHHGYRFRRTGVETLLPDPVLTALVTLTEEHPELGFIRYLPDYEVQLGGQIHWVDIKAGKTLERHCYHHYLTLDAKQPTSVCLWLAGRLGMVRVSDIRFKKQDASRPGAMPVEDLVWKCPRKWDGYQNWKAKNPTASGTSYGELDLDAMATSIRWLTMPTKDGR